MRLDFLGWLRASAAGFFISGSSGTGKSQLMRLIMYSLATTREGFFLIDPHGDLARDLENDLATLPLEVQDRVIVIRPTDLQHVVGLNPLSVANDGNDLRWRSRLVTKVMHTAFILLSAWGERDFNSKPVLFKWTFRFLLMLGRAGLAVTAVRFFFDPAHAVYQALLSFAPDFISRMEMEELAGLRPKEREEIIASCKNRFLGWLSNPIVELILSQSARDGVMDVRELIQQRRIVIISLESGEGELHDTDVEILANLWLSEIAFAIFSTPQEKRVPTTVLIDELPTYFQSSFPLLSRMMPTTRKTLCRWVLAGQGAFAFPDATESSLLNLMIGQCGVHFIFGHRNFKDCEFFAKVAKFQSVDLLRRKHVERQLQQTTVGHDIVQLYDESINWTEQEQTGGSDAAACGQSDTATQQTTHTTNHAVQTQPNEAALRQAVTDATADMQGQSNASSTTNTMTSTNSWSRAASHGGGRTVRQTLVPRLQTDVIEHVTFMTAEEQFLEIAAKIAGFDTGECIVHRGGKGAWIVKLPMVRNRYFRTPRFAQTQLQALRLRIYRLTSYRPAEEIVRRQEEFTRNLVDHIYAAATEMNQQQEQVRTTEAPVRLTEPENNSHAPWNI